MSVDVIHSKLPNSGASISRASFRLNNVSYGINATCKPPPISEKIFIQDLQTYFEINTINDIEVFMGDISIDILDNANNDVNDYLSALVYFGFLPYIKRLTRLDSGTCLDHIFVEQKLRAMKMKLKSYVPDTHLTDHAPVLLNINFEDFLNASGDV
ncbi:hypothetical protein HHI36_010341 [Cryptolaemus montrouzieri]|uniref:Uncharacterized protein n=1 Tax=Cryptolaemus montrouzieri TaxID=559131 RepID=A0ABD2MJ76_9CUCU